MTQLHRNLHSLLCFSGCHLTGVVCRLLLVLPGDASGVEILWGRGLCYDDLVLRAHHPAVPGHRDARQHVVALRREMRKSIGGCCKATGRLQEALDLPVTISVRMLACRNCSKTLAVTSFILFCMMIKPRKSMLFSITSLKTQSQKTGNIINCSYCRYIL